MSREDELEGLHYFWFIKGNLEKCDKVLEKYPELKQAYINYKLAEKTVGVVINELLEYSDGKE